MVLVVGFQLTSIDIQGDDRRGVEVIADMRIGWPGTGVASSPIRQVELRSVMAGDPGRSPAGLPGIAGPGLIAWLAGAWNRISLPHLLPSLRIQRRDIAADPVLATRHPDDDLALRHQRRQGQVVPLFVIVDGFIPAHLAGFGIKSQQVAIERANVYLVLVETDARVGWM